MHDGRLASIIAIRLTRSEQRALLIVAQHLGKPRDAILVKQVARHDDS